MIVYCSNLTLAPTDGRSAVAECIARWLGQKAKSFVDPARLLAGMDERLPDASQVVSTSTSSGAKLQFPFLASVVLSHGDPEVGGRQWTTEIGLKQDREDGPIFCSVLLQTNDVSARVTAPIQPSRPRLIESLARTCSPTANTPGLLEKKLDETNAAAFSQAVEHHTRRVPWIVVSPTREGNYLVSPTRLRSLLVGLAEVFEIPPGADTRAIQEQAGSKYAAWLGAVNIIFPARSARSTAWFETVRLLPDRLIDLEHDGGNPATDILARVTHRTNLPALWNHTAPSSVAELRLRQQLSRGIQKAQKSEEASEYVELLVEADREIREKEDAISLLREDVIERDDEISRLTAENDGLKHALSGKQATSPSEIQPIDAMTELRAATLNAMTGKLTLEQSLLLLATIFPDRVVVLDTAYSAARDSAEFRYTKAAFGLLRTLVTDYWESLSNGQPDAEARKAFGKNDYSAKEAQSLSEAGRKRRTFMYQGEARFMEAHLKIGVKDSVAETLRVHFDWRATEKRLVIGHCGGHLDF